MFLFLVLLLTGIPTQLMAQDILDVEVLPPGNINTVINGDTLEGGVRAHPDRVYRLKRGSVYQVTEPMRINGNIKIVAAEGENRPPVLAPGILPDNSSIDHFFSFIGKGSKVEISDVYLLSVRSDQSTLGWSEGIRINADSVSLKLRGVIFDAFSSCALRVYAHWSKLDVQDCTFRNNQHSTAYYGGQAFLSDAPNHMDTCLFINNTFMANASYIFSIRGYDRYSVFQHNTVMYGMVNPFLVRQASNLYVKDNIFYSPHAYGGVPGDVIGGSFLNFPDTISSGIIHVRTNDSVSSYYDAYANGVPVTGPEVYLDESRGVTSDMLAPGLRNYDITNNAYYWPDKLQEFYTAYNDTVTMGDTIESNTSRYYIKRTLTMPKFMTGYTQMTFDSLLAGIAHIEVGNNFEADPGFDNQVVSLMDTVILYVSKIVTEKLDRAWHYNPTGGNLYPPTWPLPENLAYSNSSLQSAGEEGYALGDLNWFPSQKEAWDQDAAGVTKDNNITPEAYSLSEAYPNPFNPETNFKFSIAKVGNVKLSVYNILGQKVRTLLNSDLTAGSYTAKWDGRDDYGFSVSSGVYFFQLESGSFNMTKKMVLMK
jgi:hypothetical protein